MDGQNLFQYKLVTKAIGLVSQVWCPKRPGIGHCGPSWASKTSLLKKSVCVACVVDACFGDQSGPVLVTKPLLSCASMKCPKKQP